MHSHSSNTPTEVSFSKRRGFYDEENETELLPHVSKPYSADYTITPTSADTNSEGVTEQVKLSPSEVIYRKNSFDHWREQYEVRQSYCELMYALIKNSVGPLLCLVINMLVQVINVYFIGNTNNVVYLAGVGMGSMLVNVCALAPTFGLNSALQSMVS